MQWNTVSREDREQYISSMNLVTAQSAYVVVVTESFQWRERCL